MVVLAASVVTKSGKPIISRQFLEMPRSRIEGLLASFPKLIPTGSQHTTIETPEVRYVYQPLEDLYLLIVTTKSSNILQDISTLSLLVRCVSDLLRSSVDEPTIIHHAFDLIAAFDEIVSLGYRENVNVQQVRAVLEAESHEEKVQEIIARNKEAEVKEEMKRRAKQLEMQRRETARMNRATGGVNGGGHSGGFGAGGGSTYSPVPQQSRYEPPAISRTSSPASVSKPAFQNSGMKLGKKPKQADLLSALASEVQEDEPMRGSPSPAEAYQTESPAGPDIGVLDKVDQESVHISISENLSLSLHRDGGISHLDLRGSLNLLVTDPSLAKLELNLASPTSSAAFASEIQFKQHPQVAKFGSGGARRVVAMKDPARDFPVGKALGVVKWKLEGANEAVVPLAINCWPSPSNDGCDINIEFELEAKHLVLRNVVISIPLPEGAEPKVSSHTGSWSYNSRSNALEWFTETVDEDAPSGTLEVFVGGVEDVDEVFPVQVGFVAGGGSLSDVSVESATLVGSGEQIAFSQESVLVTDKYLVI
ncbi:coatomer subunit delta [Phaffia rhodozyma]|uniref:Coatomer subunit delta n=1 Tax=Phaffia rhodozyma TaxID=264483 RepID=A0A0F7SJT5_PHARH|nr:coatomer subunit delta [Phaffia rhodozyma]